VNNLLLELCKSHNNDIMALIKRVMMVAMISLYQLSMLIKMIWSFWVLFEGSNFPVFLPRELCQRGICCYHVSVRLSAVSRSSTNMAKPRITQTTTYDSSETGFLVPKFRRHSNEITPNGGAKQRWDMFKSAIFDQHLTFRNGAR